MIVDYIQCLYVLINQLVDVQEVECKVLVIELYDCIGQNLLVLNMSFNFNLILIFVQLLFEVVVLVQVCIRDVFVLVEQIIEIVCGVMEELYFVLFE